MNARTVALVVALVAGGTLAVMIGLPAFNEEPTEETTRPTAPERSPDVIRPEPPAEKLPVVAFSLPEREGRTPAPLRGKAAKQLKAVRETLHRVVVEHGREPTNPWAVSHALLALGLDLELTNGEPAVDYLFGEYATSETVGDEVAPTFPPTRGSIRIEPHTDLLLKALAGAGASPDRAVVVEGKPTTLGQQYRYSLWRAWIMGTSTGFHGGSYNDAPWALRALATWAPEGLSWTAQGGRGMTLSGMTHRLAQVLDKETAELKAAMAAGEQVKKDTRRGIFAYTCGGQHLLQGVAYATARGFAEEGDKAEVCAQLALLRWRVDVELGSLDPLIESSAEPIQLVLLGQRLKFLGHYLETVHEIGAMGLCELDAPQREMAERVADELHATVEKLDGFGVWDDLAAVQTNKELDRFRKGGAEQVYLDFIGDAAHAVRGIDLALGEAIVRY